MMKYKNYSQSPLSLKGVNREYALNIIKTLYKIKRTGWVDRGVKNPETVGEHTDQLIILANQYFPEISGLNKMLKIHDWPEADKNVGDRRTDVFCLKNHRITKKRKKILELEAMKDICINLGYSGKVIINLWLEYEKAETKRAKIAYQIDKLQAILKAIDYQRNGQPVVAQEFIDCNGDTIQDPILKNVLKKAIAYM
jgi:putative hydrolase of HD superfamily